MLFIKALLQIKLNFLTHPRSRNENLQALPGGQEVLCFIFVFHFPSNETHFDKNISDCIRNYTCSNKLKHTQVVLNECLLKCLHLIQMFTHTKFQLNWVSKRRRKCSIIMLKKQANVVSFLWNCHLAFLQRVGKSYLEKNIFNCEDLQ